MRSVFQFSRLTGLSLICLWLASVGPASAAIITYSEATDGELAGQSIGTFDVGANTVTGSEPATGVTSFDSFQFTIAAGQQLDSIVMTSFSGVAQAFTLAPPGALDATSRYGFLVLTAANLASDILPALLASDPGKTATAPLPAGVYQVVLASVASTSYQYTFNVSEAPPTPSVPEPATLTLMGLGMFGVALARRRRTAGTRD